MGGDELNGWGLRSALVMSTGLYISDESLNFLPKTNITLLTTWNLNKNLEEKKKSYSDPSHDFVPCWLCELG